MKKRNVVAAVIAGLMLVSFTVSAKSKVDLSSLKDIKAHKADAVQVDESKKLDDLSKSISNSVKKPVRKKIFYKNKAVNVRVNY